MHYQDFSAAQLQAELRQCTAQYEAHQRRGLSLDLSRGKPGKDQLALSMDLLGVLTAHSVTDSENGVDCRNYGGLEGIPEARRLMAELLGVRAEEVLVGGNSSLTIMHAILTHAMLDGIAGSTPWVHVPERKFLCPVPGYDRHFAMTEHFGFQLIPVPMLSDGPDMDLVERLVAEDETIKGIWCVPKFQNPTGVMFSNEVIRRFAALSPRAADFRIFWDNAYCVHSLYPEDPDEQLDLLHTCEEAGNPDHVYEFCSTSKMAFPGGGIAAVAASPANLIDLKRALQYATIGPDKLNQLRQARYFRNKAAVQAHMARHAAILRPKFEAVEHILEAELGGLGIAEWTTPRGGYFLSFNTLPHCASRVISLCAAAGVKFTPAGATFPCGHDPKDRNIRIAPSYAALEEIRQATELLALCTKLASLEALLGAGSDGKTRS
ncbi:aminotransferase class I/II-fold pyridoxal phosphate-dependent enzyme [Oscillibacter sp.]|uniref:aminotransferase class I/II-fold pyridoxal phosphate-dependent enzyme n=1 Tax=Oscillibacter sp. TaxID=1945593 RepID=UPI00261944D3|nr:aminotransferase class I/II-fold pyridoxal phosphate-dependent enzyme [Oscillibacter sp.]MDD3347352.1 aminotransferase class I/II-fold pyridoxal phosphate-dependent enzyme [Oscillibacter sp.]